MQMNLLKDLLKAGETAIGTTAGTGSDVRFLAEAGFDFLLFDTQHSPIEIKELVQPIAGMRGHRAVPIIRVSDNRADQICHALDAGAKGIVVPMVNTADEAKEMVRSCKYPFEGIRSSSGIRGDWGKFESYRDYMDAVNEEILIIPMIETVEAMTNLDRILSVDGIDVVLIGPSDLSISLDVSLDYLNPRYLAALATIAQAASEAGVVPGMFFVPPGMAPQYLIERGYRFFTMPWDGWARDGIQAGLAGLR